MLRGNRKERPISTNQLGRKHRRCAAVALITVPLLLLASACSGVSPTTANNANNKAGVTQVLWWSAYSGALVPILAEQVKVFNETHPNIHVTNVQVPNGLGNAAEQKFLSAVAGGDPPDIWTSSNPVIGTYALSGAIQPLTKYITGQYAGLQKWMYPLAWSGGVYNNVVYGLPESMNSFGLFYNTSLLKQAGITSPPTTLAELDADAAKTWKFSGNRVEQVGFFPDPTQPQQYTSYFGANLDLTNGKYDLANNPRLLAMMNWYQSYSKYPYGALLAFQATVGSGTGAGISAFQAGKQAFQLYNAYTGVVMPQVNPDMVGKFGAETFPIVPGGPTIPSTFVNGNYDFIPKGSKNASAAFTFLAWLSGWGNTEENAKVMSQVGWLGASPAITNSSVYQTYLKGAPFAQPMVAAFPSPANVSVENTPAQAEMYTALIAATQNVVTNKMTPLQALQYVDSQANAALAAAK
jgi:multiple sugar transport system substrate-binding protein